MKTREEKLAFLDSLIGRAELEQSGIRGDMYICFQDVDMFMRNCAGWPLYRKWKNEAFSLLFSVSSKEFQQNANPEQWEYAKQRFIDALRESRREIELFGEDAESSSDPLEALRQILDEARDAISDLEARLADVLSRIDDAECRLTDIEIRANEIE